MLSDDDQRSLESIRVRMENEDPDFAGGLRDGHPHRPRGDLRWPLAVVFVLASLTFIIGQLGQYVAVMLVGTAATWATGAWFWLHMRRSQHP